MYASNYGTCRHNFTIGTGAEPLCFNAVPYLTFQTMAEFYTGLSASGTVNHLRSDVGRIKQLSPLFRSFDTQAGIIRNCGNPGIAGNTIQTATSNKFFHINLII